MSETVESSEPTRQPPALPRGRRIASDRLMGGRREIIIEHGSDEYRLRVTGSGKLILTK
jgi:hemin uptake protein HemP